MIDAEVFNTVGENPIGKRKIGSQNEAKVITIISLLVNGTNFLLHTVKIG